MSPIECLDSGKRLLTDDGEMHQHKRHGVQERHPYVDVRVQERKKKRSPSDDVKRGVLMLHVDVKLVQEDIIQNGETL